MEIIHFDLFNLHLQEPIALLTNWLIASFSFFAFFQLKRYQTIFENYWKTFYLILGISMIFGGLGHLFFHYAGIYGKFPSWTLGVTAGIFSSFAMISIWPNEKQRIHLKRFVVIKSLLMISLALATRKFVFVAIDTSFAYIIFCGYMGIQLFKKGFAGMNYIALGVLVLFPSALFFGLKINLHRFLNKDDISHLFMVGCIACFYLGITRTDKNQLLAAQK
ncbi:MAG: hypothetical protein WC044_10080 [Crocinitomicaceae bacterium]